MGGSAGMALLDLSPVYGAFYRSTHGGKYNGGLKKYRYDGWGVGGGFSYGYQWIIGKHWNLETELGIGYAYLKYDKYLRNRCGRFIDTGHRNYWGPTKLSISFMYLFKSRQK